MSLVISATSLLGTATAHAAPAQLTYQGRILKTDGTPLTHNNVSFIFQIKGGVNDQCLIYQEQVSGIDLSSSAGVFEVPIGTGTVSYPTTGSFTILDAFNNSTPAFTCGSCTVAGATITCSPSGSFFNPTGDDTRALKVQFYDGNGWKTISPSSIVRSVPFAGYALSAQKLGANSATDFLLRADVNNPGGGSVSCNAGSFLTWDASTMKFGCAGVTGASGGTVKTVAASAGSNPYLTVSADTTNPVVTLNVGTVAGTVAAGNDSRLVNAIQSGAAAGGDLAGTYPNPSVGKIQNIAVSATAPNGAGQVLRYNGAAQYVPTFLNLSDIRSSVTPASTAFPGASCTSKQTLTWISLNDTLICTAIAIDDSQIAFTTSRAANTVLAAPNGVAGVASFRTLTAADLPIAGATGIYANGGNSFGTTATLGTNDNNSLTFRTNNTDQVTIKNNGNVGIGTIAPTAALQLRAGTAAMDTAPLKLTSGINLATPEAGAVEYDGTNLYFTDSTAARRTIATTSGGNFTNVTSISNSGGNVTLAPNATTGSVLVTSTTPSTGSANGALVVSGGAGFGGDIYSAGSINAATTISALTSILTPQLYGSATPGGNIRIDGTSNAAKGNVFLASTGGNVGIGTTTPRGPLDVVRSSNSEWDGQFSFQFSTSAAGTISTSPIMNLMRSRGTAAAPTAVLAGDTLGTLAMLGHNGTQFFDGALIYSRASEDWTPTNSGTSLTFSTTTNGTSNSPVERMLIDHNGNIGVGTNTPTSKLHVENGSILMMNMSGSNAGMRNVMYAGGNTAYPVFEGYRSLGTKASALPIDAADRTLVGFYGFGETGTGTSNMVSAAAAMVYSSDGAFSPTSLPARIEFGTVPSGSTTLQTRMTIKNDGNVGIGTTAPAGPLHIKSSAWNKVTLETTGTTAVARQGSDLNGLNFTTNALYNGAWSSDDATKSSFAYIQHLGNSRMEFRVAPPGGLPTWNTAMAITDSGNVGIGMASPQAPLDVNGIIAIKSIAVSQAGSIALSADGTYQIASGGGGINGIYTLDWQGPNRAEHYVVSVTAHQYDAANVTVLNSYSYLGQTVLSNFRVVGDPSGATRYLIVDVANRNGGVGNLSVTATGAFSALNLSATPGGSTVVGNAASTFGGRSGKVGLGTSTPSNMLSIVGDGVRGQVDLRSYTSGSTFDSPGIILYRARGSVTSPSYALAGDRLGHFLAQDGVTPVTSASPGMSITATENHSATAQGAAIDLVVIPDGSIVQKTAMTLSQNGNVGIGTTAPGFTLDVNGSIAAVGALQAHSDRRLKRNIVNVDSPLEKLQAINGVYFDWRKDEFPKINFEGGRQLGVIAQEVEKVFPEAVAVNKDGIRSVAYTMLIAPLIEAVKELYQKTLSNQAQVQDVKRELASVKERADKLESENAALKALVCKDHQSADICKTK